MADGPEDLADDDLVAHALAVHVLAGDDTAVYDACVAELQGRATLAVCRRCLELLGDARPEARALGADVLGLLGVADGQPFADRSVEPLVALASADGDPLVLDSVIGALGHLGDPAALAAVLAHAGHRSYRVRGSVARALPRLADDHDRFLTEDDPVVLALLGLIGDDEPEVRDWATFGLASRLRVDGARTRAVLRSRLADPDEDARAEALVGLARRRDPAAIPLVADALGADAVGRLAVEAAALLRAPELLDALHGLVGWWDVDEPLLAAAQAACDPEAQAVEVAVIADLVERLGERSPGLEVSVACDLVPVDHGRPSVEVTRSDGTRGRYDLAALLSRSAGDVARAADLVAADHSF